MSDSYYELIDDADPQGEKFTATDMVRSTWSAAIQHAAPVSSLLQSPESASPLRSVASPIGSPLITVVKVSLSSVKSVRTTGAPVPV